MNLRYDISVPDKRTCTKCGMLLPHTAFRLCSYIRKRTGITRLYLNSQCKICARSSSAKNGGRKLKHPNVIPTWRNLEYMEHIYRVAMMLQLADGIQRDVDHIVSLKSDTVTGLHCEDNLQILPRRIHRLKTA